MWTWVPLFLAASFAAGGLRDPGSASLAAFVVVGAGGIGCVAAGFLADRLGRTTLTMVGDGHLGHLRDRGRLPVRRGADRDARGRQSSGA